MKKRSQKNLILFLAVFFIGFALIYWGRIQSDKPIKISTNLLNSPAPAFELADRDGNVYSPGKLKGKNILLFFSEGLACYPACWDEMLALAKDKRFEENNTVVLSVVADKKEDWLGAIAKMPELEQAKVIFDQDAKVSQAYGMLNMPSTMHRGTLPGHSYVIIDKQGIVKYVYDDIKMGKNGDKLLAEIKNLK